MSLINTKIKSFETNAFKDGKFIKVSDSDFIGKWTVVFFYPADFTFVCPTELGDLADYHEEFEKNGAQIFSVSTDTHFVHKAWHDASDTIKKIKFAMLADPTGQISKNFDVYIEQEGLANRGSFVVDPTGTIQIVEITCDGVGRDAKELFRKFKAAKFTQENPGQVCPAKWTEGSSTLQPNLDLVGKI